jgi:hypothetical protein
VGKPSLPIVKDVAQIRNDATGLNLQKNVGRTGSRRWNRIEAHGLAHGMETRREHCVGNSFSLLH